MTDTLTRAAVITRADTQDDSAAWELGGIAVPWDTPTAVDDGAGRYLEVMARGAWPTPSTGLLFYDHDRDRPPIGLWTAEDAADGLRITATLSRTSHGADVHQLLLDGVLDRLSVAFRPVAQTEDVAEDGTVTVTRTAVEPVEVSVVPFPAYPTAAVDHVRASRTPATPAATTQEGQPMTEDMTPLTDAIATVERRLSRIEAATGANADPAPVITARSLGDWLKRLSAGDPVARAEAPLLRKAYEDAALERAYTGATFASASTRPAYVDANLRQVESARRLTAIIGSPSLPAEGMSLVYPMVKTFTDGTGVQAKEGDQLGVLKLELTDGTAPVVTIGSVAPLPRQVIDRAPTSYVDTVLNWQMVAYGKAADKRATDALTSATGVQALDISANASKASAWRGAVLDAAAMIYQGSPVSPMPDVWVMSQAAFRQLAMFEDTTGRPLFTVANDGTNSQGTLNVRTLTGDVAGLPVMWLPGLTGTDSFMLGKGAMASYESGPFRLDDDDVMTLTHPFALYGYQAVAILDPQAIVRVKVATA